MTKVRLVAGPLNNQDVEVEHPSEEIVINGVPYYKTGGMYSLPLYRTNGTLVQWPVYIFAGNDEDA